MKPLKEPLIKPSRRGLLHKKLDVPMGQKIPAEKIAAAVRSGSPSLRKEAEFAKVSKTWKR